MNSKVFLVTRPNFDPATHYIYHWSEVVIAIPPHSGSGDPDTCHPHSQLPNWFAKIKKLG